MNITFCKTFFCYARWRHKTNERNERLKCYPSILSLWNKADYDCVKRKKPSEKFQEGFLCLKVILFYSF